MTEVKGGVFDGIGIIDSIRMTYEMRHRSYWPTFAAWQAAPRIEGYANGQRYSVANPAAMPAEFQGLFPDILEPIAPTLTFTTE